MVQILRLKKSEINKLAAVHKEINDTFDYSLYNPGEMEIGDFYKGQTTEKIIRDEYGLDFFRVAKVDGKIVGYIHGYRSSLPRLQHSVKLGLGILKEYRGQGIGKCLIVELLKWAKESGIKVVELTVVTENTPAVRLYTKLGFKIDGKREYSLRIGDKYYPEYYMSLVIN